MPVGEFADKSEYMSEDFERTPIYDAETGGFPGDPANQDGANGFFIREPFRVSLLTIFSLAVLVAFPISNVLFAGDPSEMVKQLAEQQAIFYGSTLLFLWILFGMVTAASHRERQSMSSLGYTRISSIHPLQALAFFIASALILAFLQVILSAIGYQPVGEIELLLPKDASGRVLWFALSVTAAVCEETAYRGYFITRVARLLPKSVSNKVRIGIAMALSALTFGLGHTYQGVSGFVLITAYGLMIGALFLYSRSLWPCIFAHFLLDFIQAFVPLFDNSQ